MKPGILPASRSELYQRLGLIDRPVPEDHRCHACDTCRKRETFSKGYFDAANQVAALRLALRALVNEKLYDEARREIASRGRAIQSLPQRSAVHLFREQKIG